MGCPSWPGGRGRERQIERHGGAPRAARWRRQALAEVPGDRPRHFFFFFLSSPGARPLPRWPLFLIAAPAAVAVWSGWVGLGALCGFGVIHPLPGIGTPCGSTRRSRCRSASRPTARTRSAPGSHPGYAGEGPQVRPPVRDRRPGARHDRPGHLPPAGRRARGPGAVAGRGARVLPAGGDARVRRRADAPAALAPGGRTRTCPRGDLANAPVSRSPATCVPERQVPGCSPQAERPGPYAAADLFAPELAAG